MDNQQQQTVLLTATAGLGKPGFEWLGYGYRGYRCYADLESKTPYPVYDLSNVKALYDEINTSTYETYTATSKCEYYNRRFADLKATGSYELYSATVTANFDESTLRNYNLTIGTVLRVQKNYRLTKPDNTPLDKKFQQDLIKLNPDELFDKYGTHVLRSFIVGARYEASSYIEDDKTDAKSNAKASLSGGLKLVFDLQADGGTEDKQMVQTVKERAVIKSYGGGMEKEYKDWFDHLDEKLQDKRYAAIAAFEENSLQPLYEVLEENDPRKAILKARFNEYMQAHADPVMLEPDPSAPPSPAAATPMKYGDHFILQSVNGEYVISANSKEFSFIPPSNVPTGLQYFPKLRKAEGVPLYFSGEKTGEIDLTKYVLIKTTEKSVSDYNCLGRFNDFRAYYYTKGYEEEKWVVKKIKPGNDKDQLFDGDLVEISMLNWPGYNLCRFNDFLSTTGLTKIGCGNTTWKIVKCK